MNYELNTAKTFMENIEKDADITLEHSTRVELEIQDNLNQYYHDQDKIETRLQQLDEELDVESYLQSQCAALSIAGVLLGVSKNKKWLALSLASSLLLIANAARGGARPFAFFRNLGFRTRAEIEKERYALKAIRGDFKYLLDVPNAVWNAVNK
jgi:hypothetical protein